MHGWCTWHTGDLLGAYYIMQCSGVHECVRPASAMSNENKLPNGGAHRGAHSMHLRSGAAACSMRACVSIEFVAKSELGRAAQF